MAPKRGTRAASKTLNASAEQTESRQTATIQPSTTPAASEEAVEQDDSISSKSKEEQPISAKLQALRRRVQEKEEYTALLKQIQELEQEQQLLTQHLRIKSAARTPATRSGPRFEKHSLKYYGKHL
jgi:hypothetical protein